MDIIVILAGAFCICAGAFDWDFFFRNHKAAPLVRLLGRQGARRFYIGLGAILVLAAIFL